MKLIKAQKVTFTEVVFTVEFPPWRKWIFFGEWLAPERKSYRGHGRYWRDADTAEEIYIFSGLAQDLERMYIKWKWDNGIV